MLFACQLLVPHGGVFVLFIPNAVTNLPLYLIGIAVGTLVTTGALFVLKRRINVGAEETTVEAVPAEEVAPLAA
jgi:fructose PTS system EIIBC or EIIC component